VDWGADQYGLCGALEPNDGNGDAPVRATNNGASKEIEDHIAPVAIHFMHYNFARPHKSLLYLQTLAMATGV
jgi:hypothetical protein